MPTFEDAFYFLWEEGKMPIDVDPTKEDGHLLVKNKLQEILNQEKSNPVGFLLPLNNTKNAWHTCEWQFRRKHIFLLPGNSPIGLRLPLNSLIKKAKQEEKEQQSKIQGEAKKEDEKTKKKEKKHDKKAKVG